MRTLLLATCTLLGLLSQIALAEPLPSAAPGSVGLDADVLARIDGQVQTYVDEGKLPGIVLLVARDGRVAHAGIYGKMDLESGTPMRRDALFRIYSMTKPITGVALMTLYDEGRFQLDDPVSKYLPEFDQLKVFDGQDGDTTKLVDLKRPITVRDLMCHTAGLAYGLFPSPVDNLYRDAQLLDRSRDLASMIERLAKLPLAAQPGEKWMYSIAVDVQGRLVEVLSGKRFDDFLAERVFKPLQMNDTAFFVASDKLDRMTVNYTSKGGRLEPIDGAKTSQFASPPAFLSGGGGLVSTADDYVRFAQMMLNRGELDGVRILKPETVDLMTRNHLPDHLVPIRLSMLSMPNAGFGLDFAVRVKTDKAEPDGALGEYWWGGAASTQFFVAPREDLICVGMTQFMPMNPLWMQAIRTDLYKAIHPKATAAP